MNKIELYDSVELLEDYREEKVIPPNNTLYRKGSTGAVVEMYGDVVMVEFSYKEYEECLPCVPIKLLKKIN